LGSDNFADREAASKRLAQAGEHVWEALFRAQSRSRDPEVRGRCRQLLEELNPRLFTEVGRLGNYQRQVNCMALSVDGRRLLTGGLDRTVRLWDVVTGNLLLNYQDSAGAVWCVALSSDGKRALSAAGMHQDNGDWERGTDFAIRVWDLSAGKMIGRLEGHTAELRSLAFSPDGRQALSAGWDQVIRLWDLETGKEVQRLTGHTAAIRQAVFTPDGQRVLSASRDRTVRLWDLRTGKERRRLEGHTDDVFTVVPTPNGRRALSAGADRTLRLWDLETGKELRRFEGHRTVIWRIALSPDGRYALSGAGCLSRGDQFYIPAGYDNEVRIWEVETGAEVYRLEGHTSSVMCTLFTSDGRQALTAGSDGTIRVWKTAFPVQSVIKEPRH
jgi:WD40 repeat protein